MAFLIKQSKGNIDIILQKDTSIDHEKSDYQTYKRTLNEKYLTFKEGEQPTKFVLKKILDFESTQIIKSMQLRMEGRGKKIIQKMDTSYIMEEIRRALVDIKNPPNLPEESKIEYKREGEDHFTSKELIAFLEAAGVVDELYGIRFNYLRPDEKADETLKKN